jgi:3-deoxy-D-manno-octulosonic acid (KDO) 8-phosphate synthase
MLLISNKERSKTGIDFAFKTAFDKAAARDLPRLNCST